MSAEEYRFNLRFACAWRVVAELLRRHRTTLDLRVNQLHPGLSAGGELIVTEGPLLREDKQEPRFTVSVVCGGGAAAGSLRYETAFAPPRSGVVPEDAGEDRARNLNVIRALLSAGDPRRVIDEIEARVGLPSVEHLPPMDRASFIARVIAGFMERRALSRIGWRPSCGWYDTSALGCAVSEWIAAFPDEWRVLNTEVTTENQYVLSRGAARFWILSRVGDKPEPRRRVEIEDGPAMVLDMATGRASLVGLDKPPFDLWGYHQTYGHSVLAAVRWVEDRVQAEL